MTTINIEKKRVVTLRVGDERSDMIEKLVRGRHWLDDYDGSVCLCLREKWVSTRLWVMVRRGGLRIGIHGRTWSGWVTENLTY